MSPWATCINICRIIWISDDKGIREKVPLVRGFFCGGGMEAIMDRLEEKLGYRFRDRRLLEHAMTHSSYANEHGAAGLTSNERLEFLGDSVLGMVVAVVRTAHDQQRPGHHNLLLGFVNGLCNIYTTVIRGTPMLVQLFIWSFVILRAERNKILVGFVGLGVNSGAYVAEIIRGGLMSVDIGQTEAGRSLGLNYLDTMRFIVIPQAFKAILPSLGNEFITLFKDTSLVQAIGGMELLYYAYTLGGRTFDYMPPLIGIALMYLVVVIIFTWLQGKLERRLRQSDRR